MTLLDQIVERPSSGHAIVFDFSFREGFVVFYPSSGMRVTQSMLIVESVIECLSSRQAVFDEGLSSAFIGVAVVLLLLTGIYIDGSGPKNGMQHMHFFDSRFGGGQKGSQRKAGQGHHHAMVSVDSDVLHVSELLGPLGAGIEDESGTGTEAWDGNDGETVIVRVLEKKAARKASNDPSYESEQCHQQSNSLTHLHR